MSLYEIKQTIQNAIQIDEEGNVVNPETGELLSKEEFAKLGADLNEGIENLCLWVKDLRAEAKAHKEEKEQQAAWEKACSNKAESIEKFVGVLLGGNKFKTAKCAYGYRKVERCVCHVEAEQLPEQFQRVKHSVEADLTELKAYLKAGNTVEGVEIIATTKGSVK